MSIDSSLHRFNIRMQAQKPLALACGILLCLFLGVIDYYTGYELNFFIFYLIPILWVTWVVGVSPGYVTAILCVFVWGIADKLSGHQYSEDFFLVWDVLVRLGFFVINVYMISRLRGALEREKEASRMDHLTGVANSKAFFEMTQLEIYRCRRNRKPLSVAFLDCDNFKEVNDRFGHSKGDEFLRQVADTLKKGLRATDILARVGGDEFAVVLPDANAQDANAIFVRLRNALSEAMQDKGFNVTMSVGVASFSKPPEEAREIIAQADEFMYAVKKHGKNRVNIQTIN
jgi:diguanylate cyclase (GGDEF)-like protein